MRDRVTKHKATKRFDVELFIVHPTLDPSAIQAALGLSAKVVHRAGSPRKTPQGRPLSGTYPDTRWRYSRRYETHGQHFAEETVALLDKLEPNKAFLKDLRSSGGTASLLIQFLGDGYFGDEIPIAILQRMINLELDFAIECFVVPQKP